MLVVCTACLFGQSASAQPSAPTPATSRYRAWLPITQTERSRPPIEQLNLSIAARVGYPVGEPTRAAVVEEGIAYWVQGRRLLIWNLTRIGRQGLLGTVELPEETRPGGLAVSEGIATLLSGSQLMTVDVRQATTPELRHIQPLQGLVTAFVRRGARLFVATDPPPDGGDDGRVQIFDLDADGAASLQGSLEGQPRLTSMFAEGERLWAAAKDTVLSFDVASGKPRLLDRHDGVTKPIGVFLSGDRLWVVDGSGAARSWPVVGDHQLGSATDTMIPLHVRDQRGSKPDGVLSFDEVVAFGTLACVFTVYGQTGFNRWGGRDLLNMLGCLDLTDAQIPRYVWRANLARSKPYIGLSISHGVLAIGVDGLGGGILFSDMTPQGPGILSVIDPPSVGVADTLLVHKDTLYSMEPEGETLRAWRLDVHGIPSRSAEQWGVPQDRTLVSTLASDRARDPRWLVFARQHTFGTTLSALDLTDGLMHGETTMAAGAGEARASEDLIWFPEASVDSDAAGLFSLSDSGLQRVDLPGMDGTVADVGWSGDRPVLAWRSRDGTGRVLVLDSSHTEVLSTIWISEAPTAIVASVNTAWVATGSPWSRNRGVPRDRAQLFAVNLSPAADPVITRAVDLPMSGVIRVQSAWDRLILSGWSVEAEGPDRLTHWICDSTWLLWLRSCFHQSGEAWSAPSWALSADGQQIYRSDQGIWTLYPTTGSMP